MDIVTVKQYKNNVFCLMHKEKKYTLSLYNALNHSHYENAEDIEIVTLQEGICIRMHNDASFVIDSRINLYEQQSTRNPNMPLRNLFYIAEHWKKLTDTRSLYRSTPVKLPEPRFAVFYNGTESYPAQYVQRLSDLYERTDGNSQLELTVTIYNINEGCNDELLSQCESLRGYMTFVNKVRHKLANENLPLEEAVPQAVDECIKEGIMADFFQENREEVIGSSIWGFDQKLNDEAKFEDGYDLGKAEGLSEGLSQGLTQGRSEGLSEGRSKTLISQVCKKFQKQLSVAEIADALEEPEEEIAKIVSVAETFAPDYNVEKIYEALQTA